MTPEQIKQLLADAKKMDLSSGLTEMLRQRTSAPGWKTQVQQQASQEMYNNNRTPANANQ